MTQAWNQWEGHVVNDEFQLKKYLGGSEQCAVFLTETQGRQPQPAAIKLIPADPANAELQLSRWRLAQRLSHPHLIRLLHTGRCRLDATELIFVVMEYAEENLAQILPERPLTPQEAREMLEPALDALAWLHGQGWVHGRLKPTNVMAVKDQLKLASDGLCRAGEIVSGPGKPSVYDPPEKPSEAMSPAADMWSLGMTLAEVLTQRLPLWNEKEQADPAIPENLPEPFLDIVRGCLRRDPRRRWTIAGIAARLHPELPQPSARAADLPQASARAAELPQPSARAADVPQASARAAELPQPSARAAEAPQASARAAEPLFPARPAAGSRAESTIRRYVLPAAAVLAVAALLASLGGLLRRQPDAQQDVSAVKPEPKPASQEHDAGRSAQKTVDQQPGSGGSHRVPASGMKPRPASLRSEAPAAAINRGSEDNGVVNQVLPDVPQSAKDTITGTVRVKVRVNVDPSGSVAGAKLDSPGPSQYFARLALQAARNWKFAPYGQGVGREFILRFEFRNSGTRAFATRAAP